MIESGDINDNQILSGTILRTDARGLSMYRYMLPSGRVLCSEWIPEDAKRQALRKWTEVVRAEIVEDATALRRARAKQSTPATTGTVPSSVNSIPSSGTAVVASTPLVASDPLEMAQQMHDRLDKELASLHDLNADTNRRITEVSKEVARWSRVLKILKETD